MKDSPSWDMAHYKNFFTLVFSQLKLITKPLHLIFSYLVNKWIGVSVVVPVHGVQH